MNKLVNFFVCIFLMMSLLNASFHINAQEPDTDQEELTLIPHAEVIARLLSFREQVVDDNCMLPCFANIYPDETTLSEIQELLVELFQGDASFLIRLDNPSKQDDSLIDLTLNSEVMDGYFDLSFTFSLEDEILRRFKAYLFRPASWLESSGTDISEVLADLGIPDQIYISIAASQPPQFSIVLGYEDLGTVFLYTYRFDSEQLTQNEEPILLCGSWSKTYSIDVWIQSVDEDSYAELLEENLRLSETASGEEIVYSAFWPLEEMTDLNVENFTQFLVDNPEWCFDALSYEGLLEAGYSY